MYLSTFFLIWHSNECCNLTVVVQNLLSVFHYTDLGAANYIYIYIYLLAKSYLDVGYKYWSAVERYILCFTIYVKREASYINFTARNIVAKLPTIVYVSLILVCV